MKGNFTPNAYLNFSFIIKGKGLRWLKARVTQGGTSKRFLFETKNFRLFITDSDELKVSIKKMSFWKLKRFLRLYVQKEGGICRTVQFYFSPFK